MSVIGEQIKKFRIERGITQDRLGQLVGVTTQAVSRWERGGTPDAEILPELAKILGVSIDALFGREEESLSMSLARRLSQIPEGESFGYALNLCWAIELGLLGNQSIIDDFMNKLIEDTKFTDNKSMDYFSKVIFDSGMAFMRMSPDLRHFFIMAEPEGRLRDQLSEPEKLRRVFEAFSDKNILSIVYFLYSVSNKSISTSFISKNTGISPGEVDRCMDILCGLNLARHSVVETAEGEINTYHLREESSVIPMLCFADELAHPDPRPFFGSYKRTEPLL